MRGAETVGGEVQRGRCRSRRTRVGRGGGFLAVVSQGVGRERGCRAGDHGNGLVVWSPPAPPMDLRLYMDRHHRPFYASPLQDPALFSSAVGVGRTSELTLWVLPAGVSHAAFRAADCWPRSVRCPNVWPFTALAVTMPRRKTTTSQFRTSSGPFISQWARSWPTAPLLLE